MSTEFGHNISSIKKISPSLKKSCQHPTENICICISPPLPASMMTWSACKAILSTTSLASLEIIWERDSIAPNSSSNPDNFSKKRTRNKRECTFNVFQQKIIIYLFPLPFLQQRLSVQPQTTVLYFIMTSSSDFNFMQSFNNPLRVLCAP